MRISEAYVQTVHAVLRRIQEERSPVIIFGTGRAGWYIQKVLEHFKIPVSAFSVNRPAETVASPGHTLLSPEAVVEQFPGAQVLLGVFQPRTAEEIRDQLEHLGQARVDWSMAAFLYVFFTEVAHRCCDREQLAKSIDLLFKHYEEGPEHHGRNRHGDFVSPFVTSVITQKCSLRCRDCAQFIPYYEAPVHFPVETVLADLRSYARAFDVVPEISLHGGEPFLHPHLAEICREVAGIANIVFISFVTNGSIMPSEAALRQLADCGADVHQSGGYGKLSKYQEPLTEAFRRHGIYSDILFCSPTEMWTQATPYQRRHRSTESNDAIYQKCTSGKTCCQIMDGELHRCALSMHAGHQGVFPLHEGDFLRLHGPEGSGECPASDIRQFLSRDTALSVCDYCDPDAGTPVPPAIQLPRPQDAIRP